MKTQTIEVEGLPEGWKAVAYRVPKGNIEFVFIENVVRKAKPQDKKCLIVEKIQPRRIVLEETWDECNYETTQEFKIGNNSIAVWSTKVLREVKETDIPLQTKEPKLSLSVDECEEILNEKVSLSVYNKMQEFIKENS